MAACETSPFKTWVSKTCQPPSPLELSESSSSAPLVEAGADGGSLPVVSTFNESFNRIGSHDVAVHVYINLYLAIGIIGK